MEENMIVRNDRDNEHSLPREKGQLNLTGLVSTAQKLKMFPKCITNVTAYGLREHFAGESTELCAGYL